LVHILMVIVAGFWSRVRAMITGRASRAMITGRAPAVKQEGV